MEIFGQLIRFNVKTVRNAKGLRSTVVSSHKKPVD